MLVEDECQAKSTQRAANTGRGSAWESSQPRQMTGRGLSLQQSLGPEQIRAKEALAAGRVETTEVEEHRRLQPAPSVLSVLSVLGECKRFRSLLQQFIPSKCSLLCF